jgi:hypothetical protein
MSTEDELAALEREWQQLEADPQNPRSVLDVIEYSLDKIGKGEVYVNRLLQYFLDPEEPHGLSDEFLRAFLEGLPNATVDEWPFDEDTYDLSRTRVQQQVPIDTTDEDESTGWLDLFIDVPGNWFLLIELKFSARETGTEFYYRASEIDGHDISTYESGQYYLYIHDRNESEASEPNVLNLTWQRLLEDILEPFYEANHQRYPHRTVVQLDELIDDIRTLTNMSEQQQREREKIELYLEHVAAIEDVSDTFDERWESFTGEWPVLLADTLSEDERCTPYTNALPDRVSRALEERGEPLNRHAAIQLEDRDLWVFRGKDTDWASIFKEGWWLDEHDQTPNFARNRGEDALRIGFTHRMGANSNRSRAIQDHELVFYFRNMGANPTAFKNTFVEKFNAQDIETLLPDSATITGNKEDMIEAEYGIRVNEHEDFFDAYVSALERAFRDLVLDNDPLVETLTECYDEAVETYFEENP